MSSLLTWWFWRRVRCSRICCVELRREAWDWQLWLSSNINELKLIVGNKALSKQWSYEWNHEKHQLLTNRQKEMATHSNVLAWKVPRTEEAGATGHRAAKTRTQLSTHILVQRTMSLEKICPHVMCYVPNQAARKDNHTHVRASGAVTLSFQTAETNVSGAENCLNFLRPEDSTSRFLPQNFTNVHRKRFM